MSISSDEVNYLIYRYLQENGFTHSAFTFAYESLVAKSSIAQTDIPPGALITFLQKGLEYIGIEEHIEEDGTIKEFDSNYSLLSPFICQALGTKEERRIRKPIAANDRDSGSHNHQATNAKLGAMIPSSALISHEAGIQLIHLQGHQGEVFMCLWNPLTKELASGSADGTCRVWTMPALTADFIKAEDGTEVSVDSAVMPHSHQLGERYKDVTSVHWSADGQFLATGCYDGVARVWKHNGVLVTELRHHAGPVFSLKWSRNGKYLVSGSHDRQAVVWDPQTGNVVKVYSVHDAPVLDVDWGEGTVFATCSSDRTVRICRVSDEGTNAYRCFVGHQDEVNSINWSPDGTLLASCSDDGTAKIWHVENGLKHDLLGHAQEIYTVRWTPTGPATSHPNNPLYLCTASFDGTVKIWNAETGIMKFDLQRRAKPVYSLALRSCGNVLAAGSWGGFVTLWSLVDGSVINEIQGSGDTFDVSWSPDGNLLGSCFSSGSINVLIFSDGIKDKLRDVQ